MLLPCLAVALTAATAVPVPTPGRASVVDAASIDAAVRAYREATRIPGVAVAVTRGRDVVHTAGYGRTAEGDAVTDSTVMAIASLSKSFTALAVMQLVEDGKVRLDATARTYLPEFTMADERAGRITVRQLLDHSSGMSDRTFRSSAGPAPRTLREAVAAMRRGRLATDPGTAYEYHNPNYQVAARLVEVVGGQPFGEYLRDRVFRPLGMTGSISASTADDLPPGARGHRMIAGLPVALPEPPAFGAGSGGVLSTARDMAAWLIAQGGSDILSPGGLARMRRATGPGSYGLGWDIGRTESGAPLADHTGGLVTVTAYQALLPASGHGLVVLANAGSQYGDAPALGARLIALIEGRSVPPTGSAVPLIAVDAALLLATIGGLLLPVRGVRRARHWARRRGTGPAAAARLLPYLAPVVLVVTLHRVIGALYRGRDISWRQAAYLYPSFTLLLAVVAAGCVAVLAARVLRLVRAIRAGRRPAA